jgi:hypothetical protein
LQSSANFTDFHVFILAYKCIINQCLKLRLLLFEFFNFLQ